MFFKKLFRRADNIEFPFGPDIYNNRHFHGENSHYTKYIILTHPRTGSNYLNDSLRSHRGIVSFSELFHIHGAWFGYKGYPEHNSRELIHYRNRNVTDFLNRMVFRKFSPDVSAVGFKIFYDQPDKLRNGKKIWQYLADMPDLKIIHLKRRNLFNAYVSLKIASKTNSWLVTHKRQIRDDVRVSLRYRGCMHFFSSIQKSISLYNNIFGDKQHLEIFYEDMVSDGPACMTKVQTFLNVDPRVLKSSIIKQSSGPVSKYVKNYRELKEKFMDTPWHTFFEE